jgi:hypothetical protein
MSPVKLSLQPPAAQALTSLLTQALAKLEAAAQVLPPDSPAGASLALQILQYTETRDYISERLSNAILQAGSLSKAEREALTGAQP